MRIWVSGVDRSADLGPAIAGEAEPLSRAKDAPVDQAESVLRLREAGSEAEYLDKLEQVLWGRTGVSTCDFYVPHRRGMAGRCAAAVKRLAWKLLRYQHDRIAFQQNTVNTQLTVALELQRGEYRKRIAELEARIESLEAGRRAPGKPDGAS